MNFTNAIPALHLKATISKPSLSRTGKQRQDGAAISQEADMRSFLTILGTLIIVSGLALTVPATAQECEMPPPPPPPSAPNA